MKKNSAKDEAAREQRSLPDPEELRDQVVSSIPERVTHVAFPIVGVGASAGGLDAFVQLLTELPPDTGMAFVLIQHLDPTHPSILAETLVKATKMIVAEAKDGDRVQPNHVYVIPPNAELALRGEAIVLSPREAGRKPHLPIDFFFSSLAQERGDHAIGVILSGTASDGPEGKPKSLTRCSGESKALAGRRTDCGPPLTDNGRTDPRRAAFKDFAEIKINIRPKKTISDGSVAEFGVI